MRVFMTGGSGVLGHYIIKELLSHGHSVTDYSLAKPLIDGIEYIEGDITHLDSLLKACRGGYDALLHFAGIPGPGRTTPERLMHINVVGTVNALEAALRSGIGKVIFASSVTAYGFGFQKHEIVPRYLPIDEAHPADPQDEYGLSKLLGELTCKSYSDAHGIQTICLRFCNIWYVDKQGAQITVRSGWAKGLSVEELWEKRYVKSIVDGDKDEWPVPGPSSPKKCLWVFTDARDSAIACRLGLENNDLRHEVITISGHDTCSNIGSQELVSRFYPQVTVKEPLEGFTTLFSNAKATRLLGYRPQFSWRRSDFYDWWKSNQKPSLMTSGR